MLARRHHAALQAPVSGKFGLEPVQWFHHSLRRERARADLTGRTLALVLFTPRERRSANKTNARIARVLRQKLCPSDEAGWFDERRIAVLLPDALTGAASQLADEVCLAFPLSASPPLCEVFAYPTDHLPDEGPGGPPGNAHDGRPRVRHLAGVFIRPLQGWKRLLDLVGTAVGLVLLAPLLLLIAIAIKLESPGPVLFRQRRTGRGGTPFVMYKFRSMAADAEARKVDLLRWNEQDGPAFKIKADPRVTRLGRWLRKTSLDELPQLINVIRGEMSLVGPRPLPCDESDACLRWQRRRLDVTPGLTCTWQVRGRSRVTFDEWMRMDLEYVDSVSPGHDLRLLIATLVAVVRGRGAY
ncbi:MAG TPA: sugar transferase [Pirellulales bacterium]|nr:sugar transferase [Pirellulales bacterium]